MLHRINSWLKNIPIPTSLIPNRLTLLIESQNRIGWDHFLSLGDGLLKWQQFQQQHISTQSFKQAHRNEGIGWVMRGSNGLRGES
jgi:hypothetical protein